MSTTDPPKNFRQFMALTSISPELLAKFNLPPDFISIPEVKIKMPRYIKPDWQPSMVSTLKGDTAWLNEKTRT